MSEPPSLPFAPGRLWLNPYGDSQPAEYQGEKREGSPQVEPVTFRRVSGAFAHYEEKRALARRRLESRRA